MLLIKTHLKNYHLVFSQQILIVYLHSQQKIKMIQWKIIYGKFLNKTIYIKNSHSLTLFHLKKNSKICTNCTHLISINYYDYFLILEKYNSIGVRQLIFLHHIVRRILKIWAKTFDFEIVRKVINLIYFSFFYLSYNALQ